MIGAGLSPLSVTGQHLWVNAQLTGHEPHRHRRRCSHVIGTKPQHPQPAQQQRRGLELVHFAKGQRKDDLTQQYLATFTEAEGVLFVGRAQEKAGVWRTQRRYNPVTGGSYAWLVRSSAFINFFYFYCVDADFGPFFLKFSTYFPYAAKLCVNGNEWTKRQAAKVGIGFEALDNGFAAVDDVEALQRICDSFGSEHIEALLSKWLKILPHPFTSEDEDAGYRYELSILQAEFSLTQMLDRPVSGRIFFEQVLHDNLDIGRPDHISLVFDRRIITKGRRCTPGRFRTRIITEGVVPSLHVDYKNAKIKQYHKQGRALRTETTINDTRDFGGVQTADQPDRPAADRLFGQPAPAGRPTYQPRPIRGAQAFTDLTTPIVTSEGTRIPGLRFGDPRVHALLQALLIHRLLPHGFTNRDLRTHIAPLLGMRPEDITAGKMTYDLRRLRAHGVIERIPKTRRYQTTDRGLQHALLVHPRPQPPATHRAGRTQRPRPTRSLSPAHRSPRIPNCLPRPRPARTPRSLTPKTTIPTEDDSQPHS